MPKIEDDEIKNLNIQKQELIRKFDNKEINEEGFNIKMGEITNTINEKIKSFLNTKHSQTNVEPLSVDQKIDNVDPLKTIVQPTSVEIIKKKRGRKPKMVDGSNVVKPKKEKKEKVVKEKRTTLASLIIKALMMKSVKNWNDMAEKVSEWDSTVKKENVIKLARHLMYKVEKGKQPKKWPKYTWDKKEFMLTEK